LYRKKYGQPDPFAEPDPSLERPRGKHPSAVANRYWSDSDEEDEASICPLLLIFISSQCLDYEFTQFQKPLKASGKDSKKEESKKEESKKEESKKEESKKEESKKEETKKEESKKEESKKEESKKEESKKASKEEQKETTRDEKIGEAKKEEDKEKQKTG